MTGSLTHRERFLAALSRREPDRVPVTDTPWSDTVRRWHEQGLPAGVEPDDYFDYGLSRIRFDQSPMFEVRTLHKDDEYIVESTPFGGIRRNHRTFDTTPEVIDWAVKSKADWESVKERLGPGFRPDAHRVDWVAMRTCYEKARSEGRCVAFSAAIGYDHLQSYIKSDALLELMLVDPDWVRDMVETVAALVLRMAETFLDAGFRSDVAFLFNDMAYRNGPLFSPKVYRQCIQPSDRLLCEFFHRHETPVIYHTDGDVHLLIPHLIESGIDCLQPLEVKAGMDVRTLKGRYGDRLSFMGNIDVRAMAAEDPAVIEAEIRDKLEVAKIGGGYLYHSDHSVPNDVSFTRYCRVMELVRIHGAY